MSQPAPQLKPIARRKPGWRSRRRLWILIACLASLGLATGLMLQALSDDVAFFVTPAQIAAHPPPAGRNLRLGGMVVAGSVHHGSDGGQGSRPFVSFSVTDGQAALPVRYRGILPDLFREGQSVVVLGHLSSRPPEVFIADEVLAKHDETYMPKEVADALKKSGKWDPRFGPPPSPAQWRAMTASHPAPPDPTGAGAAPLR
ncbi:cytochrome c maturation protein CcmE [Oecophyllibacter saccharovorans]|uniref:cytochrome c maturation protein CcmE n=1 Tax=Oecophyllibacter saccharovorans TaxID=2558360 RepID=UPI00116F7F20|nr:cytochrome c maturation protein CcmE [Oecophyllibacter saccharovorans]TPW36505.1 cytochrome c maturation protein CcmE [Oecophyllibacter saccharovorans]